MSDYTKKTGWVQRYDKSGEKVWAKGTSFTHKSKIMAKPDHELNGRANASVDLTSGGKAVLPYVKGFVAQARKDGSEDLPNDVTKRLALGTDAMQYSRGKLNMGRGNVDGQDPRFPQANTRTHFAYQLGKQSPFKESSWPGKAAAAELARAGNCDQHAAVSTMFTAGKLDEDSVAAKVVYPGHTFSELRGKNGKTEVSPQDVIVDSWAKGSHAVLRNESEFADGLSPLNDRSLEDGHTQRTYDQSSGLLASQKRAQLVAQNQGFGRTIDKRANEKKGKFKSWEDTPIESDLGRAAIDKRARTFQSGDSLTKNLQTVFAARQMGASVRGAAKET